MALRGSDIRGNPEKAREKARLRKGIKHRNTIIKEKLEIREIDDLKETVLKNFKEFSESEDKRDREFATKEIAKYVFPQKREHSGKISHIFNVNINF